jgi:hypothetical protein
MNEITNAEVNDVGFYHACHQDHGKFRVAAHFGISPGRAGRILKKVRENNASGHVQYSEDGLSSKWVNDKVTSQIKQTFDDKAWRISADQVRIKSLDELLKQFKIDTRVWRVKKFECVSHEQAQAPRPVGNSKEGWKLEDPRAIIVPLYNVRAEFERIPENDAAIKIVESLKQDIINLGIKKTYIEKPYKQREDGKCLEISIPDVHFGKLAWAPETGWENYDLSIAKKIWREALASLLNRPYGNLEQIWFILGNDMIHFDSKNWATTRGTLQDGDSRYHKVFSQVQTLMIESIEDMLRLAPVKIKGVVGNHDEHAAWHMANSMEMAFRGFKYVNIDNSPNPRKYDQFGCNMLLWDHGNEIKKDKYPSLMAKEQPKMFCSSRFHEVHTGHFHTKKDSDARTDEAVGVRVRVLPSLSASDSWHAGKGYVGNIRSAESYLWDKEDGLIAINSWNVPERFN